MAKTKQELHHQQLKTAILHAAAKGFLQHGYTDTTLKSITTQVGISVGSLTNIFQTKEDLLCELVKFVLERQFSVSAQLVAGKTDDQVLYYAAETVLQLYIVEMDENLRDVYCSAYSLPKPSAMLQETVTAKLERIFQEYCPAWEAKDFYMMEIATGGIMRGFMTVPCNIWFTMDMKVAAFLRSVLRLYYVPEEKISAAIAFVGTIDFASVARQTIAGILQYLETSEHSDTNDHQRKREG